MNKQKVIGISILVVVALLVITTGVVFASGLNHGGQPFYTEEDNDEYGGYWGATHGRRGRWSPDESFPPMHEVMVQAVADATSLTVESIEERIAQGERLIEIALDAGLTEDEYFDLMVDTREVFLTETFANGWINEERYQWMLERLEGDEFGPGYGGCHRYDQEGFPAGGRGFGMGRGRRW